MSTELAELNLNEFQMKVINQIKEYEGKNRIKNTIREQLLEALEEKNRKLVTDSIKHWNIVKMDQEDIGSINNNELRLMAVTGDDNEPPFMYSYTGSISHGYEVTVVNCTSGLGPFVNRIFERNRDELTEQKVKETIKEMGIVDKRTGQASEFTFEQVDPVEDSKEYALRRKHLTDVIKKAKGIDNLTVKTYRITLA